MTRSSNARCPSARGRRGALLLLVLSMLTLFLMIGTLMLVLAMRARSTARAFANAVTGTGFRAAEARDLLDEALMRLIRGTPLPAGGGPPARESLLGDRYGTSFLKGNATALTSNGGNLTATVNGITGGSALDLRGRILTIVPKATDSAPISSFRILSVSGTTFELANLRTVEVRTLPTEFPCDAYLNGREFSGATGNEGWDGFDAANLFLTQASANGTAVTVQRPAFGTGQAQVDNDGDGVADGVWLDDAVPAPASGLLTRVSYLVLDLGGRLNVNAHGSSDAATAGTGPAAIDGSKLLPDASAWTRLLSGGTLENQPQFPPAGRRRSLPALGGPLQGRFGGGGATDTYAQRLDFDGPRPASREAKDRQGNAIGNLFTYGELESVLRPFDADAFTLPQRLVGLLGDTAEEARMLVTTDSWDTCGLTGAAARSVVANGNPTTLPQDVAAGLRFSLGRTLGKDDDAAKQAKKSFFTDLRAVVVAAGAADDQATSQWVANVIDFVDVDTTPGQYGPAMTQGVEPSSIQKDGQAVFMGWDTGQLQSAGELLGVPTGTKTQIDDDIKNNKPLTSLAVTTREILDATGVESPFQSTVYVTAGTRLCRWREPGRVNVNTCRKPLWDAVAGKTTANPFENAPAQSMAGLLLGVTDAFGGPGNDATKLDRTLINRLANMATVRSDVFAVWITLELKKATSDPEPEYRRLFAIVDRSVPVGHAPGLNLNARDTIRLIRYLE